MPIICWIEHTTGATQTKTECASTVSHNIYVWHKQCWTTWLRRVKWSGPRYSVLIFILFIITFLHLFLKINRNRLYITLFYNSTVLFYQQKNTICVLFLLLAEFNDLKEERLQTEASISFVKAFNTKQCQKVASKFRIINKRQIILISSQLI